MKNIGKFRNKLITSSVVIIIMLSSIALLGGAFGTGAPPFTVTFEEHNLPVGTTWSIAWNNTTKSGIISNTTYSGGGSASVSLYNGSYEFRVIGTPWWFNKTVGKFTVAGSSLTIIVNFTENFSATFIENKLPTGTKWGLSNSTLGTFYNTTTASGGSIVIKEASSTTQYTFSLIGTPWWGNYSFLLSSTLRIGVSFNENSTHVINFTENFTLTVKENGLYPGIEWDATIGKIFSFSEYSWESTVSFETKNSSDTLKYSNGTWQFSVNPVYYYSISYPGEVTKYIANLGSDESYSNITLTSNTTITVNFTPYSHIVVIKGYTNPSKTNVTTINFPTMVANSGYDNIDNFTSNNTGFYEITTVEYATVLFYKSGYSPESFRILSNQSVQWFNVTLSKTNNLIWNFSQNINYTYSNKTGWSTYNMNISNAPINSSGFKWGIYFAKLKQNEFIILLNLSWFYDPYYTVFNITLKLHPNQRYIFFIYTNESNNPIKTYLNASPSGYAILNLSEYTDHLMLDPLVEYSAPQAVITAPSAIPYDTAITISGANSIPSTNATITNYTWHITGPVSYTAYGKQINEFFSVPGTYKIELTVTDSNGLTNTTSTTLSVLASNSTTAIKISVTHTFNSQKNTYYFLVYVNMTNNVSISQITVSVDGKFVNTTLVKEMGYDYIYAFNLSNARYGYGNHTIKIMVFDTLGQYNSMTTYLIFGSVSGVGIISYIFTNTLLLVATAFVILAILVFLYSMHERDEIKSRSRNRNRGRK